MENIESIKHELKVWKADLKRVQSGTDWHCIARYMGGVDALESALKRMNKPSNTKLQNVCAMCGGKPAVYFGGYGYRCSEHEPV